MIFVRWFILALTIMTIPYLISGVSVDGLGPALAAAVVISILNVVVKPLLVILTLPLTVLSLGFFLLIINALVFQLAGHFVNGIHVASFGAAFFASLIVSVVSWLTNLSFRGGKGGGPRIVVMRSGNGFPGNNAAQKPPPRDLN